MATSQPSNTSELQLYRVLQRANLLPYFDIFITQGGDDVQQLCEAGEDEFLEIMALVGMASKPLHVRRLQKALQEWVANPVAFEANVIKKYPTHVMSMTGASSQPLSPTHSVDRTNSFSDYKVTPPQSSTISTSTPWTSQAVQRTVSPVDESSLERPSPSESPQEDLKNVLYNQDSYISMMNMPQPVLLEHQITAIATAAAILAQDLPPFEPKTLPKKQISKEIQTVMLMSIEDPIRMDALRKYAAIYGRFDSKRKNDKPMSLHEISVNEAAAQLCSHFPALLTRREELFPLARQVVRDSGYQYSKGHSRLPQSERGFEKSKDTRAAEVVPPTPKTEPADVTEPASLSSSSTPSSLSSSPRCYEKNINDLQSELTDITLTLTEMVKEQDRIRSALRILLETDDHEQMRTLTAEMDVLNDRQAVMTKRRQSLVNTIAKYRKNASKYSCISSPPATPLLPTKRSPTALQSLYPKSSSHIKSKRSSSSNNKHTSNSSSSGNSIISSNNKNNCHNNSNNTSKRSSNNISYGYSYVDDSNPLNTLYLAALHNSKDSLFEEGLRIATQYGMSDFAKELIGMKSCEKIVGEENKALSKSSEGPGLMSGVPLTTTLTGLSLSSPSISHTTAAASLVGTVTTMPPNSLQGMVVHHSNSPSVARISTSSLNSPLATPKARTVPSSSSQTLERETSYTERNKVLSRNVQAGNSVYSNKMDGTGVRIITSTPLDGENKHNSMSLDSLSVDSSRISNLDISGDFKTITNNSPPSLLTSTPSTTELIAGSTTTTTTITTKTGQIIEVETRRSSRRRNGEPDYYLINGGEKRFRGNGTIRRSSSSSSERSARLSSSSSSSLPCGFSHAQTMVHSSSSSTSSTVATPIIRTSMVHSPKMKTESDREDTPGQDAADARESDGAQVGLPAKYVNMWETPNSLNVHRPTEEEDDNGGDDVIDTDVGDSGANVEHGYCNTEKRIMRRKTRMYYHHGGKHIEDSPTVE